MIIDNNLLLEDFYRLFNSRLNPLDFVLKTMQLNNGYNPLQKETLLLPIHDKVIYSQLQNSNYIKLVELIIKNIKIEPSCIDVFESELDKEMVCVFKKFLLRERVNVKIIDDNEKIYIETNDMMADLIWTPLSQFHTETVASFNHFNQFINALNGEKELLFLNANAPTAFSYFIKIWVAESLGIKLNALSNILVI